MLPAVSVLMPYRNAAPTVREALESVLAERSMPIEVVAVNDGSTDEGESIVSALAARDDRIVRVRTEGVGIVGALERAIATSRAPLLARMDADDVSLPGRLPAQRDAMLRDDRIAALGTQVECFPDGAAGEGLRRYVVWQNAIVTAEDHARELFVESPLCHPSVMLRRDAVLDVGGYRDVAWAEDYDLWLRLAAHGHALAKLPTVLLRWRQRPGQLTFTDPRYAVSRFLDAKAHYLAPRLRGDPRTLAIWGAGPTGRRFARALERGGVRAGRFIDIDPRKIGRTARGAAITSAASVRPGEDLVLVAVGARGARDLIRHDLHGRGMVEGRDYVCVS